MYVDGYKGVLTGDSMVLDPALYDECTCLHDLGGSPIGNSRVKVSQQSTTCVVVAVGIQISISVAAFGLILTTLSRISRRE